jgi:hypothetical protein
MLCTVSCTLRAVRCKCCKLALGYVQVAVRYVKLAVRYVQLVAHSVQLDVSFVSVLYIL